jgi:hypothetical protein
MADEPLEPRGEPVGASFTWRRDGGPIDAGGWIVGEHGPETLRMPNIQIEPDQEAEHE